MKTWPLRYPRFNFVVILVGFAVSCLVFYRIGLVTFGAIVLVLMTKALAGLGLPQQLIETIRKRVGNS